MCGTFPRFSAAVTTVAYFMLAFWLVEKTGAPAQRWRGGVANRSTLTYTSHHAAVIRHKSCYGGLKKNAPTVSSRGKGRLSTALSGINDRLLRRLWCACEESKGHLPARVCAVHGRLCCRMTSEPMLSVIRPNLIALRLTRHSRWATGKPQSDARPTPNSRHLPLHLTQTNGGLLLITDTTTNATGRNPHAFEPPFSRRTVPRRISATIFHSVKQMYRLSLDICLSFVGRAWRF